MKSSSAKQATEANMPRLLTGMANTKDRVIDEFRDRWGVPKQTSDETLLLLRDELQWIWGGPKEFDADIGKIVRIRSPRLDYIERLRHAEQCILKSEEQIIIERWLRPTSAKESQHVVEWSKRKKYIGPNPANLPLVLAHACIRYWNRFKYCGNLACSHPFFLADRSNQRYCNDKCSAVGKRAAKKSWWRKRRGKRITE